MGDILGNNVGAMVVPFTDEDDYATHSEEYGRGGFRSVADLNARNAITAKRRRWGMLVRLLSDNTGWELKQNHVSDNLGDNGNWRPATLNTTGYVQFLAQLTEENTAHYNLAEALALPRSDNGAFVVHRGLIRLTATVAKINASSLLFLGGRLSLRGWALACPLVLRGGTLTGVNFGTGIDGPFTVGQLQFNNAASGYTRSYLQNWFIENVTLVIGPGHTLYAQAVQDLGQGGISVTGSGTLVVDDNCDYQNWIIADSVTVVPPAGGGGYAGQAFESVTLAGNQLTLKRGDNTTQSVTLPSGAGSSGPEVLQVDSESGKRVYRLAVTRRLSLDNLVLFDNATAVAFQLNLRSGGAWTAQATGSDPGDVNGHLAGLSDLQLAEGVELEIETTPAVAAEPSKVLLTVTDL